MTIDSFLGTARQREPNQPPSPSGAGRARHDLGRPAEHIAVRSHVLTANREGGLEVFVEADGNLWHRRQTTPGGDWNDWHSFGSPSGGADGFVCVDVGRNQDGRLEAFAVHRW